MDHCLGQEEYMRKVLEVYRKTPGTMGTVRRADRMLAAQLYQRGLSVQVIENARAGSDAPVDSADGRSALEPDPPTGLLSGGDRGSAAGFASTPSTSNISDAKLARIGSTRDPVG